MKTQYSFPKFIFLAGLIFFISGGFSEISALISTQPVSIEFCIGARDEPNPATFTCIGSKGSTYQWQAYNPKTRLWSNLTDLKGVVFGAKTSTLTVYRPLSGWTTSNSATFRAVVTYLFKDEYSRSATLTPNTAPSFSTNPVSQTKYLGESATFTSSASGKPSPTYQWSYKFGLSYLAIKGATSSSYTTTSARTYRVSANNTCGTAYSKDAVLSLVGITGQPKSVTVCSGYKLAIDFSVATQGTASYQWQVWVPDPFIKGGGAYENIKGAISATLSIPAPVGGFTTSHNGQFRCAVTFSIGTQYSNSAVLTVNSKPTITSHPSAVEKGVGESATFTVSATSTTTKSYQWRLDGVDISGATTASYSIASVVPGDAGTYTCRVTNSCGSVISNGADLTVIIADWPDGWFTQATGLTSKNYNDVHFASATEGWVVAYDNTNVFHTVDGGANWSPQPLGTNGNYLYTVYFNDADHGWATGNYYLHYTVDGGDNWSEIYYYTLLGKHLYIQDIHFTSNTKGWIVGSDGMIATTANGGLNWTIQNDAAGVYVTDANFYGVHFVDGNTGYACGASGVIVKTTNGGTNWAVQTTPNSEDLRDIYFVDANTGWAVGYYDPTPGIYRATILKTTNGGSTWTQVIPPSGVSYLNSVHFTDANNGVAVGSSGKIIRTNDGGDTWYFQTSGTTETLNAVHFADADNAWAVGYAGTMIRTATSGCLTPSVNLYEDKSLCENLSYQLVADTFPSNVNVDYLWTPGGSTSGKLTVTETGTYSVDVTNICGVTKSDEISVTFFELPVADAGDDIKVCDGDTVQLNASGGLTYSWTSGAGKITLPPPVIKPPPIFRPELKSDEAETVYISDAGISNPLVAGPVGITNFTVTVTDINGCSNADQVALTTYQVPTAVIAAPAAFCRNSGVGITYSGNANDTANYYWDFDNGVGTPVTSKSWNVVWDTTGVQTITLAVNEAGCFSDTTRLDVTVDPIPVSTFIVQDAVCGSDEVGLVYDGAASGVAVFEWNLDGAVVTAGDTAGPGPITVYWGTPGTKQLSLNVSDHGCIAPMTENEIIVSYPYNDQKICLVTLDEETRKNAIIWEKSDSTAVEFYRVYRQAATGSSYDLLATLPVDTLSYYVDLTSEPESKSHKYRIALLDTCGNESELSVYHKTMLLTTNLGPNSINLAWTEYEVEATGFGFEYYIIRRGPAPNMLDSITTIPNDNTTYPDNNPPAGDNYYQVVGVVANDCSPSGKFKAGTGPYNHSLSNMDDNKLKETSVKDMLSGITNLRVFPNPFNDRVNIEYNLQQTSDVKIEVYNLLGVRVLEVENTRQIPGAHTYNIKTGELDGSSIYYLRFSVNGSSSVTKLVPAY